MRRRRMRRRKCPSEDPQFHLREPWVKSPSEDPQFPWVKMQFKKLNMPEVAVGGGGESQNFRQCLKFCVSLRKNR